MPYLHLKLSHPAEPAALQAIAGRLTDLTESILRKQRHLTALTIETLPAGRWFIGGEGLAAESPPSFELDIKITAGTNSADDKAAYIAAVFGAMADFYGRLDPASYVVIHDVDGQAWRYGGRAQAARRPATARL